MFESLRPHMIFFQGWPIHNDQALNAMEDCWRMLQWMHDELMRTAASRQWQEDCEDQILDPACIADGTKAQALTLSYISLVGTMEGIAQKFYEDIVGMSTAQDSGTPLFPCAPAVADRTSMALRKSEMNDIMRLRNKLSAHTSYAFPTYRNVSDSRSTQLTSVYLMQPSLFPPKAPQTYGIGGTTIRSGQETENAFDGIRFSIHESHPKMATHFEGWAQMIVTVLQHLGQCCPVYAPFRLLRRSDPHDPPAPTVQP